MKIAFGIIGAIVLVIGLWVVGSLISYNNLGVQTESALAAHLADNQQMLGKHSTQIGEMAQVNDMYKDDLKEVYAAAMEGRYGENGSGAVMQWIQEQNPNMAPELYVRLSQRIEANRNEFQNAQTGLIDKKRVYENLLKQFPSGIWLRILGFPKTDLSKYVIVTSTHSNKAYEAGVDDGVQLRKPKAE